MKVNWHNKHCCCEVHARPVEGTPATILQASGQHLPEPVLNPNASPGNVPQRLIDKPAHQQGSAAFIT